MIWESDTCFCKIICPSPSVAGIFTQRCEIHKNSNDTTDANDFNLNNRKKSNESEKQSVLRKLTVQLGTKRRL